MVPLLSCFALRSRRQVLSGQREKFRGWAHTRGEEKETDRLTPKGAVANGFLRPARDRRKLGKTWAFVLGASSSRPMSRKSGFWKLGNFCLLNSKSWALESGIQLKESRILLKTGIQNPNFTNKDWNPAPGIRNPGYGIQNPRLCFTWGDYSFLSVFPNTVTKKKKERKETLGIDAAVVVFFASKVSCSESFEREQ